jgi:VWFA-related protein
MRLKFLALVCTGCLLVGVTLLAQDIPPDQLIWGTRPYFPESAATFRAENTSIEVPTVVRDREERPVEGLNKDDFQLFDNGRRQAITSFTTLAGTASATRASVAGVPAPGRKPQGAPAEVEPRYVALFLDDVNTSATYSDAVAYLMFGRDAAIKFLRKGLAPGERVGLFTVSGDFTVDFTADTAPLLTALNKLHLNSRQEDQSPGSCPVISAYHAWAIMNAGEMTREWQEAVSAALACSGRLQKARILARLAAAEKSAIANVWARNTLAAMNAVVQHLGEMPGRRVMLLASSGFLTLDYRLRQQQLIDAAVRNRIVINSLSTMGMGAAFPRHGVAVPLNQGGVGNPNLGVMADIAYATGGLFYHNSNDLTTGFQQLSTPPVSYVLGFSPDSLKADGSFHHLKVKLIASEHRSVDARPGYYAPGGELTPEQRKAHRLDEAVTAVDTLAELTIGVTADAVGSGSLNVSVHVDAARLPYKTMSGRHSERLLFITALFDEKNGFLGAVEGVMQLQLTDATLAHVVAHGFDAKISIAGPAGSYRLRQVVQEISGGRMASLSQPVVIR